MKNIEHIGIAVKDIQESSALYERLLGTHCYKTEEVASEGVRTAFFKAGKTRLSCLRH